ncbi:Type IV pilus biogenesis protein PilP [gamma proteobacterium IMCC2047]|nr:Type IV pilus biogenesis protein PilP [gamma proteobacterium IMCC2047]
MQKLTLRQCLLPMLASVTLLTGCSGSGEFSDLQAYVAEVNARPKGRIEPLPEFKPYESFNYSAAGLRGPFTAPVEIKLIKYQQERAKSNVKPDLQRPKEYLENFSVDAITMVGTLALTEEDVWALLDDAEGGVHRVKVGNYVGRNHGKVISINPGSVDLIEIVPDGHGGWLERPRAIKLQDGT